jgi:uncharacterized protein YbbK (DUF523 family)
MAVILVSACLLGCNCRYKGDNCSNDAIRALAEKHTLVPVCPEQLGGLPTPRDPSEIQGERVCMVNGRDVTAEYRKGAEAALAIAQISHAEAAILKANSPSCGKGIIYDGTFSGKKCSGNGITAARFLEAGIPVFTENELEALPF